MYREQILEYLKRLELPDDGYCLFGGCCLAIRNIRPTDDIDMYVTKDLYEQLKQSGWQEIKEKGRMAYLATEIDGVEFEAFVTSDSKGWQPKIQEYLKQPEIIDGYRFMPLSELREWKANVRRPKDTIDIKLIDEFWTRDTQ
jgi:hypothetical protein